jgi:pectate lyase
VNCGDKALYAVDDDGYAVASGNDFGDSESSAPEGTITSSDLGYEYKLIDASEVYSAVYGTAGVTLTFSV